MTHLDDEREFERELGVLFERARAGTRAPRGLAQGVMAQVALAPRAMPAALAAAAPEPASAFWLRIATRPSVVLAFAVAGVVAGWPQLLSAGASAIALRLGAVLAGAWAAGERGALAAAPALRDPLVAGILLALAVVPLVLLARDTARAAERWTVRLAGPVLGPRAGSAV